VAVGCWGLRGGLEWGWSFEFRVWIALEIEGYHIVLVMFSVLGASLLIRVYWSVFLSEFVSTALGWRFINLHRGDAMVEAP